MSRLSLPTPRGFRLSAAVCSYGYFLLSPNRWLPDDQSLLRPLHLPSGRAVATRTTQPGVSKPLRIVTPVRLTRGEVASVKRQLSRMLRLGEDLSGWRKVRPPEAKRQGFERMFRSPTLFEDMVKTITGCNVSWRNTIAMNRKLCEHYGEKPAGFDHPSHLEHAFPTPAALADAEPRRLNELTSVGYRADRIIRLARGFVDGSHDPAWFEALQRTRDELYAALLALHGFGPYAAANVLQLLGRYDRLAIDTETYRHFEQVHGLPRGEDPKRNHDRIERHYARYAPYQFLAYWFELWDDYQRRLGRADAWDRDEQAPNFTAMQLNRAADTAEPAPRQAAKPQQETPRKKKA